LKTAIATTLIVLAASFSAPTLAADEHNAHHADASANTPAAAEAQMVDGQVKKVDKAAAKVTLAHGPLTNLGMTMGMTMVFRVKDTAWLDQMKDGDKIRFVADKVNGAFTVTAFEPAK
jgi:Cu/Ag efflux protein CusF